VLTLSGRDLAAGRVSTGLMQATPGLMKSFRSSADRIADIFEMRKRYALLDGKVCDPGCDGECSLIKGLET